jgi:hypothetical protein
MAAKMKVAKSLNRFANSGKNQTARKELKTLERELSRIYRGLDLAGLTPERYPEEVIERINRLVLNIKALKPEKK